jgi:hypothetical protein
MLQPVLTEKLTKKFFFSVPERVYLASNLGEAPGQPIFAGVVKPLSEREAQWKRILAVKAHNRLCNIFNNAKEYMQYSLDVRYSRTRN